MSQECMELVVGLTPPGRRLRYQINSPVDSRDRFVLFALAWFADEHGQSTVSKRDIRAFTLTDEPHVRESLRRLENDGFVTTCQSTSGPSTYQLLRDELEARQLTLVQRQQRSLYELEDFGADRRPLNAMFRCGVETLDHLGREIEAYRTAEEEDLAFHEYARETLCTTNLGPTGGRQLLQSFDAWRAAQEGAAEQAP